MATASRDFTYFDRTFTEGDEVDDGDPAVTLMPHLFEPEEPKKKAPKK